MQVDALVAIIGIEHQSSISKFAGGSSLHFEGRGWQKRQGESLSSSELGNGTLVLDADNGDESIYLHLELDRIWMNETYEGTEITR
jgi:hypothetical protein